MSRKAETIENPDASSDHVGKKMKEKAYLEELEKLQTELCVLQEWVKESGARIIILLEGRDAAGKGGLIKAITGRVSPRVFNVVALPAPSDREKSQIYMQRYLHWFPSAGEVTIFDRSWYNRAGVEHVMGFCTPEEHEKFLKLTPFLEQHIISDGILLLKYWLEVGNDEQKRRFEARIDDPLRQWKLSPMDLPARERWFEYSRARDLMLDATDTATSPWRIVRSDDKRRARLNCIADLLSRIPYEKTPRKKVKLPDRQEKHAYDDEAPMKHRRWIAEQY
jgi:polyphosphate kinase 2